MRRAASILLAALLTLLLAAPALAAPDYGYTGPLDPLTGAPVGSEGTFSAQEANRVSVSEGIYYDRIRHAFAFPLGTGISEVYSSVSDGMIVDTPVSITASEGVTPVIYLDGEQLQDIDPQHISERGSYMVSARAGDTTYRILTFTITGPVSDLPGGYPMPEGFYVRDVTVDGEPADFDRDRVSVWGEGSYHIEYVCSATSLDYTLDVRVDRTPPELVFDGKFDEKGRARSAVTVSGMEEDGTVLMSINGEEQKFPSGGKLTASGNYVIQAFDRAGNNSSYQLTILMYFDVNSLVFFSLVVLTIAAVIVYIVYKRRHLRII